MENEIYTEFKGDLTYIRDLDKRIGLFRIVYTYLTRDCDNRVQKVSYLLGCRGIKINNDEYRFFNPANDDITFISVDRHGRGRWGEFAHQPYDWQIGEELFNKICEFENSNFVGVSIEATLCELVWLKGESSVISVDYEEGRTEW